MSANPTTTTPDATLVEEAKHATESARAAGGRKRVALILGIGVVAIGGYLGIRALGANRQTTDDAQIEADVVPLAPRVGGQVAAVRVLDNAHVKKGDVLVEIDQADLKAKLKQSEGELAAAKAQAAAAEAQATVTESGARGGLSSAKAQVSTSKAQVSSAEAQIASAKAQVLRAESDVRRVTNDLDRTRKLREANALPQERLDNAQSAFDAAQAQLSAAQAQLSAADEARHVAQSRVAEANGMLDTNTPVDAKVAAARANADLANARVTTAEAALEIARLNLSYATVVAPADGVISKLTVHAGQLVSPGMPVAELVPEGTYVVANFKETQVGRDEGRAARGHRGRRLRRPHVRGRGGEPLGRHRLALLPAPAGQRVGQLRQGGAARAGAHPLEDAAHRGEPARGHVGDGHRPHGVVTCARS